MTERDILPEGLKPVNYKIKIYDIDTEKLTFAGTVVIEYSVQKTCSAVYLNARDIVINKASVAVTSTKTETTVDVTDISYEKASEVYTLSLATPIDAAATKVLVTVNYSAIIQTNMAGFYRSCYKDAVTGKDQFMLSTQFEATDARRAFPCADEPSLKATFDISVVVPEQWTALSNMPIVSSETPGSGKKSGEDGTNTKIVTFDRTPIMSTYIVAWACGDFEYIESFTQRSYKGKKHPVRVYTTKGLSGQAHLALDAATKLIDMYSEVFDIEYPLPKTDLLAVHEFSHGAMENWGLITFRTTAVLFDEKTSDMSYKSRVVYVVAHELAHAYFGDLTSFAWWSSLWLAESFATLIGIYMTDKLYPDWKMFSSFVTDSFQTALQLDSLRQSHPIEVPVKSALDIDQLFDHISYLKGGSVLRMLSLQLGEKTFLKGVSNYLKKHSYGNANSVDLWNALSEVSGIDVASIMGTWTEKIGFPMLSISTDEQSGDVTLTQNRFLRGGDVKTEENETIWWAPLSISSGPQASDIIVETASGQPLPSVLDKKQVVIPGLAKDNKFFILNKNQANFYRVNYSSEQLERFAQNIDKLSLEDRIGVVADATSCATAGFGSIGSVLSLIDALKEDSSYELWSEISGRLGSIRSIWFEQDEKIQEGLAAFTRHVLEQNVKKLGWESVANEEYREVRLRTVLISAAVKANCPTVIAEATARYDKWAAGDSSAIHPSLRVAVFSAALKSASGAELVAVYDKIFDQVQNPSTVDSAEIALTALGSVMDAKLIDRSLSYILSEEVPSQNSHFIAGALANNPASRWATLQYLESNWDAIRARFSSNMVVLDRLVKLITVPFASKKAHVEIEEFFKDKDVHGFDRSLGQALDTIKTNYEWIERDAETVKQWLTENKFM